MLALFGASQLLGLKRLSLRDEQVCEIVTAASGRTGRRTLASGYGYGYGFKLGLQLAVGQDGLENSCGAICRTMVATVHRAGSLLFFRNIETCKTPQGAEPLSNNNNKKKNRQQAETTLTKCSCRKMRVAPPRGGLAADHLAPTLAAMAEVVDLMATVLSATPAPAWARACGARAAACRSGSSSSAPAAPRWAGSSGSHNSNLTLTRNNDLLT